jgi:lactoylglutathione lyase
MTEHTMTQVGVRQLVPLLMVKSMEASLRFYVDGLGFKVTITWEPDGKVRWCWMELGGVALMLQEWASNDPRRNELAGKVGAGVSFNFICQDALAFYHLMRNREIDVQRPFVGNRMWVTSLEDPDGYRLHFESPTDAPEESVYEA